MKGVNAHIVAASAVDALHRGLQGVARQHEHSPLLTRLYTHSTSRLETVVVPSPHGESRRELHLAADGAQIPALSQLQTSAVTALSDHFATQPLAISARWLPSEWAAAAGSNRFAEVEDDEVDEGFLFVSCTVTVPLEERIRCRVNQFLVFRVCRISDALTERRMLVHLSPDMTVSTAVLSEVVEVIFLDSSPADEIDRSGMTTAFSSGSAESLEAASLCTSLSPPPSPRMSPPTLSEDSLRQLQNSRQSSSGSPSAAPTVAPLPPTGQSLPKAKLQWGLRQGEQSRMVYVSWLPRIGRATSPSDKKACELRLKTVLHRQLNVGGLCKVLLYPPNSAHCKLLFNSEQAARLFLTRFGGRESSYGPKLWKREIASAFGLFAPSHSDATARAIQSTPVRVVWADASKPDLQAVPPPPPAVQHQPSPTSFCRCKASRRPQPFHSVCGCLATAHMVPSGEQCISSNILLVAASAAAAAARAAFAQQREQCNSRHHQSDVRKAACACCLERSDC